MESIFFCFLFCPEYLKLYVNIIKIFLPIAKSVLWPLIVTVCVFKADQQEESQKARFASRAPIKVILDQNCVLLRLCFLHNLGVFLMKKESKKGQKNEKSDLIMRQDFSFFKRKVETIYITPLIFVFWIFNSFSTRKYEKKSIVHIKIRLDF